MFAMHSESSTVDENQRSPLLLFYVSALAFARALVLHRPFPIADSRFLAQGMDNRIPFLSVPYKA